MADTNQPSPPPQLGPVVCDVFVWLKHVILSTLITSHYVIYHVSVEQIYIETLYFNSKTEINLGCQALHWQKKCASTFMKTDFRDNTILPLQLLKCKAMNHTYVTDQ